MRTSRKKAAQPEAPASGAFQRLVDRVAAEMAAIPHLAPSNEAWEATLERRANNAVQDGQFRLAVTEELKAAVRAWFAPAAAATDDSE